MVESIIEAIIDEFETNLAVRDGDWTAALAVQAAENPPPPSSSNDDGEEAGR